MKYSVLVKRIVNVRIDNIEANSQQEGIQRAEEITPFYRLLSSGDLHYSIAENDDGTSIRVRYFEDGEESIEFLVDEVGDEEFHQSKWFGADGITPLGP